MCCSSHDASNTLHNVSKYAHAGQLVGLSLLPDWTSAAALVEDFHTSCSQMTVTYEVPVFGTQPPTL